MIKFDCALARITFLSLVLVVGSPVARIGHASAEDLSVPVSTESGLIAGYTENGLHIFKGIPYAASPTGELRWRAPKPAAGWQGVRRATTFAPLCFQKVPAAPGTVERHLGESEDCLYLNIWSGAKTSDDKLPVMVWIHGGGHNFGGTSVPIYDGAELAHKGVVVVTIAYRLGVLGFLALPELTQEAPYHASSNYGTLDQIAALKWIQTNIAKFGGDPNNVTIFGESAGSGAVNILQASPLAKGLFVRAIGESTSQMDPFAGMLGRQSLKQAEARGLEFAKSVGSQSLKQLRSLSAESLVSKAGFYWPIENDGYVLPGEVYDLFAQGRASKIPVLVGANADEGAVLKRHWINPASDEEKRRFDAIWGRTSDPQRAADTDEVLWQMWSWIDLNYKAAPKQHSYFYWFSQFPPPGANRSSAGMTYPDGPVHAAEIVYVFNNLNLRRVAWTEGDRRVADLMSSYWTNFAKTGDPNGPGLPRWPAYDPTRPQALHFNNGASEIELPHRDALEFIDSRNAARREQRP